MLALAAIAAVGVLVVVTLQSQSRAREDAIARFEERTDIVSGVLTGAIATTLSTSGANNSRYLSEPITEAQLRRLEGVDDALVPYTAVLDDKGKIVAAHPADAPVGERASEETQELVREALESGDGKITTIQRVEVSGTERELFDFLLPFESDGGIQRLLVVGYPKAILAGAFAGPIATATGRFDEGTAIVYDDNGTILLQSGEELDEDTIELVTGRSGDDGPSTVHGDLRIDTQTVERAPLSFALVSPEERVVGELASTLWPRLALAGLALALLAVLALTARTFRDAHRLERARRAADDANTAKSRFLSHVSHELKTPIAVIRGFAELLERAELGEREHGYVERIDDSGKHLYRLADDLLEVSRIEAGRVTLALELIDAWSVVEEVLVLAAPLAAERRIRLEPPTVRESIPPVLADQMRLRQVLLNLLSNAIKYNDDGGVVHVSITAGSDAVRLAVTDSGPGIAGEDIELLFEPFERLSAEQGPVRGTGLGLCVTKGLVEAMGGTITVESELGAGSTFAVELPAVTGEDVAEVSPQAPSEPATAGRLVYIDDSAANLALVEQLIETSRPGVEVQTATDGTTGLELLRETPPDLLLLDLNLPDMHGEDVLRSLRADPRTSDLPILIVSADSTSRDVTRLLRTGADAYLTKPLDSSQFLDVVDRLLATRA